MLLQMKQTIVRACASFLGRQSNIMFSGLLYKLLRDRGVATPLWRNKKQTAALTTQSVLCMFPQTQPAAVSTVQTQPQHRPHNHRETQEAVHERQRRVLPSVRVTEFLYVHRVIPVSHVNVEVDVCACASCTGKEGKHAGNGCESYSGHGKGEIRNNLKEKNMASYCQVSKSSTHTRCVQKVRRQM